MSEWKTYKLGEIVELKSGKSRPKDGELYPVYGGNGILGYSNEYNVNGDTIIIGRVGAYCGSVYFETRSIWISDNALYAKAQKGFSTKYLFYYLKDRKLNQMAGGSSHPLLTQGLLNNMDLVLPSQSTQNRIADILSSLDDKIEVNRQTNQTLEEINKTTFKEWFIDFQYPNSKGEFADSELGLIPKGWKVETFENVYDAERGLSYKGAGLADSGGTPMHNLNSVYEGGGYKPHGIKYYTGEFKDKHIVRSGDLIIANTEQGHKYMLIGYPAIIPASFGDVGIYSHHIYALRPKSGCYLSSEFMFHLLLQPKIREQIIGFANGTTVNMLKIEGLRKPKFALPPKELVEKFTSLALSTRKEVEAANQENKTLAALRDNLLPKLMKGELL